jgi:secreted PhoX family phosphatase
MKYRRSALAKRALISSAVGALTLTALASGAAHADPDPAKALGFTPITTNALPCSANGLMQFANDARNQPVVPTPLMRAGDPATPVNAPATSNKVGRVNDMIAVTPDGRYLFTPSENSIPTENGIGTDGSDGITRLTLQGPDAGKKEILADNVDPVTGANLWQRVDGMKWYPSGGSGNKGVLLASEEFSPSPTSAGGGIWQIDADTGAFVRLDWLGNYAHEGIGLDQAGNLYLGDELRGGAIYKAVPNNPKDLTQGGTLSYLVGTSIDATGWKQVTNPANAEAEANNGGAILFDRPEDFDEANGRVYFAVTEPEGDALLHTGGAGQVVNRGGVYSLTTIGVPNLSAQSGPSVPYSRLTPMIEVNDPTYANQSQAQAQQGLQFPDNLTFDKAGNLWVHEDIPDGSSFPSSGIDVSKQARNQQDELYVFTLNKPGDAVVPNPDSTGPGVSGGYKVADMRTSPGAAGHPCENEFTGGIFSQDGKTLYINQQHWDNPTLAVDIG